MVIKGISCCLIGELHTFLTFSQYNFCMNSSQFSYTQLLSFQGVNMNKAQQKYNRIYQCSHKDEEMPASNHNLNFKCRNTPRFYSWTTSKQLEEQARWSIAKWSKICRFYQSPAQRASSFPLKPEKLSGVSKQKEWQIKSHPKQIE